MTDPRDPPQPPSFYEEELCGVLSCIYYQVMRQQEACRTHLDGATRLQDAVQSLAQRVALVRQQQQPLPHSSSHPSAELPKEPLRAHTSLQDAIQEMLGATGAAAASEGPNTAPSAPTVDGALFVSFPSDAADRLLLFVPAPWVNLGRGESCVPFLRSALPSFLFLTTPAQLRKYYAARFADGPRSDRLQEVGAALVTLIGLLLKAMQSLVQVYKALAPPRRHCPGDGAEQPTPAPFLWLCYWQRVLYSELAEATRGLEGLAGVAAALSAPQRRRLWDDASAAAADAGAGPLGAICTACAALFATDGVCVQSLCTNLLPGAPGHGPELCIRLGAGSQPQGGTTRVMVPAHNSTDAVLQLAQGLCSVLREAASTA